MARSFSILVSTSLTFSSTFSCTSVSENEKNITTACTRRNVSWQLVTKILQKFDVHFPALATRLYNLWGLSAKEKKFNLQTTDEQQWDSW